MRGINTQYLSKQNLGTDLYYPASQNIRSILKKKKKINSIVIIKHSNIIDVIEKKCFLVLITKLKSINHL